MFIPTPVIKFLLLTVDVAVIIQHSLRRLLRNLNPQERSENKYATTNCAFLTLKLL
jgi:hypothetical protein